jgi:hypothetical protein
MVGINLIILLLASLCFIKLNKDTIKSISFLLLLFVLNFLLSLAGPCIDKFDKLIISGIILIPLVIAGYQCGKCASLNDWLKLESASKLIIAAGFFGVIIQINYPEFFPDFTYSYRLENKLTGFFREPSYLALSLFPAILILVNSKNINNRFVGILSMLFFAIFSRSLTLILIIIFWIILNLFFLRKNKFIYLTIFFIVAISILGTFADQDLYIAPMYDRILGVINYSELSNLSSLTYVQGWIDLVKNFERTNGLGLGLNMMGCMPLPINGAREIIFDMYGLGLNDEDGTFLFSKLVSEFGICGLLLIIFCFIIWFKALKKIIVAKDEKLTRVFNIQTPIFFIFLSTFFIRGTGYFSGAFLVGIIAISGLYKISKL